MTWYKLFLYLHIAGATIWVGGATMLQFFAIRARTRGMEGMLHFGSDVEWIGKRVLGPASLTVIGAGIGMVINGPWSFSDDWITIALVLVAIAYALVIGVMEPESKRIAAAVSNGDFEEAHRRARRQTFVSRVELAVLFLVVFDMAMKPTFADHGVVAWGLAGFGLAAVAALLHGRVRRPPQPVPAAALDSA